MEEKVFLPTPDPRLRRVIRLISIALLMLAIVFRFVHLDRKVYWHDEVFTSMVITARPGKYLRQELFQNKLVNPADVLAYQQFVPQLTFGDMLVRKGLEDAQHPPVYYALLWAWTKIWGISPAITRGFSSLLSLLLFPALYWFCRELFASPLSGWVAIALFAVSPFHLVFAQEAREFGVWTAVILASSALLLRAMRVPSWRNWVWYGLSMVLAFYTALFSLWVAIAHFLYVFCIDPESQRWRWPLRFGRRTRWCTAMLVAVALLFLPWAHFVLASEEVVGATTNWASIPLPWLITLQATLFNYSRSFFDFNQDFNDTRAYILAVPLLLLQAYAVYVLCRQTPARIWWFLLTFGGTTALAFGLPDLLFGGQRFTVTRYLIACFIGLHLAVVYLLTAYLSERRTWKFRFAVVVLSLLIWLGVLSCGDYTQANTWWNKVLNSNYHQVASLVNQSDRPLVIANASSYYPASVVSLSYLLKPETQLLLLPPEAAFNANPLPANVKTIFFFNLPEEFRQQFATWYKKQLTPAFQDPWNDIWKAE